MDNNLVYLGSRTVISYGDSLVITLPLKELKKRGANPEEMTGENITAQLLEDGRFSVDLEEFLDVDESSEKADSTTLTYAD